MNIANFEAQSAWDAQAVTPSDSNNISAPTKAEGALPRPIALYIGGAGDVTVILESGATAQWKAVPVGTTLYVRATRVKATGTTATNILALFGMS